MNSDFENRLQRQTPRQIPAEWRAEILEQAEKTTTRRVASTHSHPTNWWRELLWPCPQAWAAVAAVWLLIGGLNFAMREPDHTVAANASPSPDMIAAVREQRAHLAKLISTEPEVADRPKAFVPRPHSERRIQIVTV